MELRETPGAPFFARIELAHLFCGDGEIVAKGMRDGDGDQMV